jgi:hypothetical protein
MTRYIKLPLICLSVVLSGILLSGFVSAASLQLTKIGNLDLGGKAYNEWWYTGTNPVFAGKAATGTDVSIKAGSVTGNATPNASGDWTFATNLDKGDHQVEITQGSEKISFMLHLGQGLPENVSSGQTSQTTSTVPSTGYNQIFALSFGAGVVLLATYIYIWGDQNRKKIFEARILKED